MEGGERQASLNSLMCLHNYLGCLDDYRRLPSTHPPQAPGQHRLPGAAAQPGPVGERRPPTGVGSLPPAVGLLMLGWLNFSWVVCCIKKLKTKKSNVKSKCMAGAKPT